MGGDGEFAAASQFLCLQRKWASEQIYAERLRGRGSEFCATSSSSSSSFDAPSVIIAQQLLETAASIICPPAACPLRVFTHASMDGEDPGEVGANQKSVLYDSC